MHGLRYWSDDVDHSASGLGRAIRRQRICARLHSLPSIRVALRTALTRTSVVSTDTLRDKIRCRLKIYRGAVIAHASESGFIQRTYRTGVPGFSNRAGRLLLMFRRPALRQTEAHIHHADSRQRDGLTRVVRASSRPPVRGQRVIPGRA